MMATRFKDLSGIEVEHMIGENLQGAPLVKVRAIADDVILLGQLEPNQAREIAGHLLECAARAEYESDFYRAATKMGLEEPVIGMVLHLVRFGEVARHEGPS